MVRSSKKFVPAIAKYNAYRNACNTSYGICRHRFISAAHMIASSEERTIKIRILAVLLWAWINYFIQQPGIFLSVGYTHKSRNNNSYLSTIRVTTVRVICKPPLLFFLHLKLRFHLWNQFWYLCWVGWMNVYNFMWIRTSELVVSL